MILFLSSVPGRAPSPPLLGSFQLWLLPRPPHCLQGMNRLWALWALSPWLNPHSHAAGTHWSLAGFGCLERGLGLQGFYLGGDPGRCG